MTSFSKSLLDTISTASLGRFPLGIRRLENWRIPTTIVTPLADYKDVQVIRIGKLTAPERFAIEVAVEDYSNAVKECITSYKQVLYKLGVHAGTFDESKLTELIMDGDALEKLVEDSEDLTEEMIRAWVQEYLAALTVSSEQQERLEPSAHLKRAALCLYFRGVGFSKFEDIDDLLVQLGVEDYKKLSLILNEEATKELSEPSESDVKKN